MAGENNFNANKLPFVVYNADGEKFETTRPNAREMVNTGNYFWSVDDIGNADTPKDGPKDPTADTVTVFDKDGEPVEVSQANAREMVNTGNYTWAPAHAEKTDETSDEDADATDEDGDTGEGSDNDDGASSDEATASDEAKEPVVEDPLDPVNTPLADIAQRVTGDANVEAYLDGFAEANLREMMQQRYGEKAHHKASKQTIIAKMLELEEAKLDAEDSGDSDEG